MNIFEKWREPINTLTHLIALILICPFVIYLIFKGYKIGGVYYAVSFLIFALSIIGLYCASTIYHMLKISPENVTILKKIDHMMIFILISGTYTPICLIPLKGVIGYSILVFVWLIAFFGIFLKFFWIKAPRALSTCIYISMGWIAILAIYPISKILSFNALLLLFLGGIIYTLGAIIYSTKYPNFKYFGFHEVFHLFVIAGSICHIIFMYKYIL